MGLVVVGLALLDISLWWLVLDCFVEEASATPQSSDDYDYHADFRYGGFYPSIICPCRGGIFTKAADVGADLVGKVEARNPRRRSP